MSTLAKEHLSFDSEHRLRAENLPFDIVSFVMNKIDLTIRREYMF